MTEQNGDKTKVDVLDEDSALSGQKFVCVSFLSPENIIKDRNLYNFDMFLKQYNMRKSLEKYNEFLHFLAYKYELNHDSIIKDFDDFCKEEKDTVSQTPLDDEFKNFMDSNDEMLEKKFNIENKFQTSVRGLKVRGVFSSQEEAELRCKTLRQIDPNHDVYVGPVGMWMPFHPEAYKTGRVEYLENELNQLMHEKNNNEKNAKVEFEKRMNETKKNAIDENIEKAKANNNLLSQTITDDGELINVNSLVNSESLEEQDEIQNKLFESDNIHNSER